MVFEQALCVRAAFPPSSLFVRSPQKGEGRSLSFSTLFVTFALARWRGARASAARLDDSIGPSDVDRRPSRR